METTATFPTTSPGQSLAALVKAFTIALSLCLLVTALVWTYTRFAHSQAFSAALPPQVEPLASIPYTSAKNPDLGSYLVPLITMPVTINGFNQNVTFLLDTGAIITTLPLSYAQAANLNLNEPPRMILASLTSQTVFGYLTTMEADLNHHSLNLPVSFASIDTPVLGRHGFLDTYTVVLDHVNQTVIIAGTASPPLAN